MGKVATFVRDAAFVLLLVVSLCCSDSIVGLLVGC